MTFLFLLDPANQCPFTTNLDYQNLSFNAVTGILSAVSFVNSDTDIKPLPVLVSLKFTAYLPPH